MPAAKKPRENVSKHVRQVVDGNEGRITVNLFIPGYQPLEHTITIPDIKGAATLPARDTRLVLNSILRGLRSDYGGKVR